MFRATHPDSPRGASGSFWAFDCTGRFSLPVERSSVRADAGRPVGAFTLCSNSVVPSRWPSPSDSISGPDIGTNNKTSATIAAIAVPVPSATITTMRRAEEGANTGRQASALSSRSGFSISPESGSSPILSRSDARSGAKLKTTLPSGTSDPERAASTPGPGGGSPTRPVRSRRPTETGRSEAALEPAGIQRHSQLSVDAPPDAMVEKVTSHRRLGASRAIDSPIKVMGSTSGP